MDQAVVEVETAKSWSRCRRRSRAGSHAARARRAATVAVGPPLITVASRPPPSRRGPPPTAAAAAGGGRLGNVLIGVRTGAGRRVRQRPIGVRHLRPHRPAPPPPRRAATAGRPRRRPTPRRGAAPLGDLAAGAAARPRRRARPAAPSRRPGRGGVITAPTSSDRGRSAAVRASAAAAPATAGAGSGGCRSTVSARPSAGKLSRSRARDPRGDRLGRRRRDRTAVAAARAQRAPPGGRSACWRYIARFVRRRPARVPGAQRHGSTPSASEIVELDRINLGFAAQSERGLVVPAVRGRAHR